MSVWIYLVDYHIIFLIITTVNALLLLHVLSLSFFVVFVQSFKHITAPKKFFRLLFSSTSLVYYPALPSACLIRKQPRIRLVCSNELNLHVYPLKKNLITKGNAIFVIKQIYFSFRENNCFRHPCHERVSLFS